MSLWEELASSLSTLFLKDYEMPVIEKVTELIEHFHNQKPEHDNAIVSLQEVICAILMQMPEFYLHGYMAGAEVSNCFRKKFSYQGDLTKDVAMIGMENFLKQNGLLCEDHVQSVVDYLKAVTLFHSVSTTRMSLISEFFEKLFSFYQQMNGISSLPKTEEYMNVLRNCREYYSIERDVMESNKRRDEVDMDAESDDDDDDDDDDATREAPIKHRLPGDELVDY